MNSATSYAKKILQQHDCIDKSITLGFSDFKINVISNDDRIIQQLNEYFLEFVIEHRSESLQRIHIFQSTVQTPDVAFMDWARDIGKAGRKDAFFDMDDGRLCHKIRTGMNYVLCDQYRIAYGPVLENFSQAVNFILNQHMEWLMHNDNLICHAAAVCQDNSGIALSAFSGGGKSTTALHLMNQQLNFVSNDRLFINHDNHQTVMHGIAKQPRINPGTILNNNTLKNILTTQRADELLKIPGDQLWKLEEKYDAMIHDLYGYHRFQLRANIHSFVILNWQRDSVDPTRIEQIEIQQRTELLDAIVKSPGPFYMDPQGRGWQNNREVEQQRYLDVLSHIDVYEVSGKIDFEYMIQPLNDLVIHH